MQNFGKIKNVFNEILVESMVTKDTTSKLLFKKYIKTIKESNILKTQFLIYSNIENRIDEGDFSTNLFVNENLKLLEKYKISDIIKENQKLIDLSTDIKTKLDDNYDVKLSALHESISNLIFTKRTAKNINEVTNDISNVIEYIKSNKVTLYKDAIELPLSMLSTMMIEKYNEKYSTLDEVEKKVLKVLIDSTDEQKKDVYALTIRECIDLIDAKLIDSDLNAKDKLLRVKDKLLNDKQEITETFVKNISKLVELKNNLKN